MRDERDHVGGDNNKDDACSFKQPKLWDEGPNESGRIACKLTASFQSNQAEIIAADSRTMETNDNNHSSKQESDMVDRAKREQNEWGLMQIVESAESKQMRQRRLREGQRQTKPSPTVLLKTPAFATNTLDEQDLDGLVGDFGSASRADLDGVNQEMGARDIQLDGQLATNPSTRSSDPLADTTQNQLHQQQQQQQQHQQQQQQQLGTVTDSRRKSSRAERGLGSEDMTNRLATWSVENRTFHSPCSCSSAGAATSACFCSCDKRQDYIISSELRGENKTANQAEPSSVLVSEGSCKGGLRKEARPRESRVAAAEDFGVDGEEQRDGPTPTNDLIRALIHKDKLAFTGRCKLVRKTGDSATQGDRGATSGDGCCNCGQSGRLEPTKYELTRDNSELLEPKSKTNKPESSERTVDMADKGVGPSCHSDDKSARNSLEFGQMEQERRLFKSTTLESLQTAIGQRDDSLVSSKQDERRVDSLPKSNPQESSEILAENTPSRKRSLFDLSALISKCQQLQLSPDWATGKAVRRSLNNAHLSPYELASRTFISMSPRKPSDPTSSVSKELLDFAAATKQTQRRHSTYMLPLLLNRDGTTASDDDEEEEMLGLVRSTCELGNDNKRKTQNSGLLSVDSGEISSLGEVQARLTTSASSPSALSTPTNEFSGCGGPCCSQQAQLVKLATENASLSRKLFSREPFEQNGDSHTESSPAGRDSRKMSLHTSSTLFERKRSQRQKGEVRLRIGSNPLDRFTAKRASARLQPANNMFHVQRASKRSSGDAQPGTIHHSSWASDRDSDQMEKRHSIINLLSSGANQGAHHLVSRLSHPRSLFTGANHSSGRPIDAKRQRASIGCNLENEQPQYDPLIPESGFKIVVMGTSGSGKTSIIQRFMYNSFDWRHMPTVEDTYFIEFPHMKNTINISISDTSGKSPLSFLTQFPPLFPLSFRSVRSALQKCSLALVVKES